MRATIYAPIGHIHKESVKSAYSSRSTRASQSPNKVEKQPKSTPDMYNPPTRITRARTSLFNTYPRGHSSLLSGLYSLECCEDSVESQTTSINAFYVTAFLRCRYQRNLSIYPNSLQRYNIILNCANFCGIKSKKSNTFSEYSPKERGSHSRNYRSYLVKSLVGKWMRSRCAGN